MHLGASDYNFPYQGIRPLFISHMQLSTTLTVQFVSSQIRIMSPRYSRKDMRTSRDSKVVPPRYHARTRKSRTGLVGFRVGPSPCCSPLHIQLDKVAGDRLSSSSVVGLVGTPISMLSFSATVVGAWRTGIEERHVSGKDVQVPQPLDKLNPDPEPTSWHQFFFFKIHSIG